MKRSRLPILCLAALAALSLGSCSGVPPGVIPPERMSELIADIHVGESYVDYNGSSFCTDSARERLRQSIYRRHGVTEAEVDSSLAWYGHNIDVYNDVYTHSIEILENRRDKLGKSLTSQASVSVDGDSVDIWTGSRHVDITPRSPAQEIRFDIMPDSTNHRGDSYVWRIKVLNTEPNVTVRWNTVAEYTDGAVDTYTTTSSSRTWHESKFVTDSMRTLKALRGSAALSGPAATFTLDSITLVRRRLDPVTYRFHSYQKHYR